MAVSQHVVEPKPETRPRATGIAFAIPAACALLALGLRLWHLGENSLWIDEALSWRAAHLSIGPMAEAAASHHDTPLYYAVLACWVKVAGDSEVALRLPSVLAGTFTVFLLSWVAWRVGGVFLGAVAGILLALNAPAVAFSQEARMYPLTGLLALGASLFLASFVIRPSRLLLCGYTALAVCLVYAHYNGWVVLAVQAALFVGYGTLHLWERRDARVLAGGAVSFAVIGSAYIPWYSRFFEAASTGVPIPRPDWADVSSAMRSALGLDWSGGRWDYIAVPLLVMGVVGVARRFKDPRVVCVAALAVVPLAMLDISLVRTPVFNLKQISPYIPGLCFVVAIGVVEAASFFRRPALLSRLATLTSLGVAALVAFIAFRGTLGWYDAPPGEDWRSAITDLRDAEQPVYIWQWYADVAADYYLAPDKPAKPLGVLPAALDDGYVPLVWSHAADQATLILSHSRPDEMASILGSLKPYFSITEPAPYFGLHVYSLRANTIANYNVDLGVGPATWATTPDGDLLSGDDASFRLQPGVGGGPFTLHVEYIDAGSEALTISSSLSPGQRDVLAAIPFTEANSMRTADVPIDDPSASRKTFAISPGVTVGTLEVRRYDLEGAEVLRSNRSDFRQWFLRRDGYLETIGPLICVWPTSHIDLARMPTMTVDFTYQERGRWVSMKKTVPAAEGLSCPIQTDHPVVVRRLVVTTS